MSSKTKRSTSRKSLSWLYNNASSAVPKAVQIKSNTRPSQIANKHASVSIPLSQEYCSIKFTNAYSFIFDIVTTHGIYRAPES